LSPFNSSFCQTSSCLFDSFGVSSFLSSTFGVSHHNEFMISKACFSKVVGFSPSS